MSKDYERGVEQASAVYKEVIHEYVAENAKLQELCADLYAEMIEYSDAPNYNASVWAPKLRELGIEVE